LKLSTANHPQTDGQTEIVNQYTAQRLIPFVNYFQDNWSDLLPILDFAAAALVHESTGLSSFFIKRGFKPKMSFDWTTISTPQDLSVSQQQVQTMARRMEATWAWTKENIKKAQEAQKKQVDKH
jgi:hypothetical protein